MKKFKPFQGPSRYIFKDPDTGYQYQAETKQALVDHIITYRKQNKLDPINFLPDVLENYWCCLPENAPHCDSVTLTRGLFQTIRGGIALLENLFYGEANMSSLAEASRRAAICLECPINDFPDRSGFIKWSDDIAEKATGSRYKELPPEVRDNLGNCRGCSCTLKAKVFHRYPIHLPDTEQSFMRSSNFECWQLPENQQKEL